MESISSCQRILTCIDVSRKIAEVIFEVSLLRCVDVRNGIACLRKINMLLKDITLDSCYISKVINNSNVKLIVMSLSIIYIDASSRFWCNCAPINCGVGKTQSLLIVPVNGSRCSMNTTNTTRCLESEFCISSKR